MSYRVSGSDSKKLVQLKEVAKQDAGEGTRRPADSEEHNRGSAVGEFHEPLVHSANEPLELDKHIRELAAIDNTEDRAQPEQQAEKPAFDHNINLPPQLKDKMVAAVIIRLFSPLFLLLASPVGTRTRYETPETTMPFTLPGLLSTIILRLLLTVAPRLPFLRSMPDRPLFMLSTKLASLWETMIEALFKPISNPSLQARMMFPDPQCLASPPAFLMRQTFVQQAHEAKAKHRGHVTLAAMQDPGVPGQS
ncbi:hypothetical protein M406DRAFT_335310, partial [Cryphonectria parasitica EP155]